jgi:hypothetical protein
MAGINQNSVAGIRYDFYQDSALGGVNFQSFPSRPLPHTCLMIFRKYDYSRLAGGFGILSPSIGLNSGRATAKLQKTLFKQNAIELPFPTALQDQTNINLTPFERDMLTEQIASKVNNFINSNGEATLGDLPKKIQDIGGNVANLVAGAGNFDGQKLVNDIASAIGGTSTVDVVKAAQYFLRSKLPGGIGTSIDLVTGKTINPRETLAFNGVQLRSHSMSWQLFPSNIDDSNRIKSIVNVIKRNSLPETQDFFGIDRAFLQYPSTVDIYLLGVNSDYFMKYKTAMVNDFTVDYGAGGSVQMVKGGKPAGVSITMGLTELEIQTSNDYGGGSDITYPGFDFDNPNPQ